MKKVLLLPALFICFSAGNARRASAQNVINNSFESDMQGWQAPVIKPRPGQKPGRMDVNIVAAPAHQVHEGKQALQIDTEAWSPSITMKSDFRPLPDNASYQQLQYWQYYQGAPQRKFGARVQLYTSAKTPIENALYDIPGDAHSDQEWMSRRTSFFIPQDARYYTVELYWAVGRGKVTFDDISLSPIAPFAAVKTGYSLPQLTNAQHTLWVASAQEKIYPDATRPQSEGTNISLSAAQGESQSVQLIYQPQSARSGLAVSIDDLKSQSDAKVLSANNINIHYVGDVDVKDNTSRFGRGGLTPDPLLAQPRADLAAGKPQSIWITAAVPRDAAAGIYLSTLHLKTAQEQIEIPLRLEVFDFAIPEKPVLETNAHSMVPPGEKGKKMRYNLRAHLLTNRITSEIGYGMEGTQGLTLALNPDNTVAVDWTAWDASMEKYFSQGMDQFLVPRLLFGSMGGMYNKGVWTAVGADNKITYGTPEWRTAVGSYVQQMYVHLKEKGWLQHAIWELWDEPRGAEMRGKLRDIAALVRANAPDAKIMVTNWPAPPYDPNINIWCVPTVNYQPDFPQETNAEFWTYNNGLYTIDLPYGLTAMRNLTWWMWDNNITGALWWNITDGFGMGAKRYTNVAGQLNHNGNGFLFYPGADGDLTRVVDSMRVAAYRAGVNDYDYFTLLAQAQDAAIAKSHLSNQMPSGRELVKVLLSAGVDKNDPNLLEQIRFLTARLIVFLHQHPGVALQLDNNYWTSKQASAMGSGFSQKVLLTLGDKSTFTVQ